MPISLSATVLSLVGKPATSMFAARVIVPAPAQNWPIAPAEPTTGAAFVWPKNVTELLAFDRNYIQRWLHSRKCVSDLVEDYAQSLYLHLCTPNKECRKRGLQDKLALYDPAERGNATTIGAWADWLSTILQNQYSKLIHWHKRPNVAGPHVYSLSSGDYGVQERGIPPLCSLATPQDRSSFGASTDKVYSSFVASIDEVYSSTVTRMLLDEVLEAVRDEIGPEAVTILRAVAATDTYKECAELLGITPAALRVQMNRIRTTASVVLLGAIQDRMAKVKATRKSQKSKAA